MATQNHDQEPAKPARARAELEAAPAAVPEIGETQLPAANRRTFLRASMAMALRMGNIGPDLAARALQQLGEYPWITNPLVKRALLRLDTLCEASAAHQDFLIPDGVAPPEFFQRHKSGAPAFLPTALSRYVLGVKTPEAVTLGNRTLFQGEFWSLLSGVRDQNRIGRAVSTAEEVLAREEKIEPERRRLVEFITRETGTPPFFLRLDPEFRAGLQQFQQQSGIVFVPFEDYFANFKRGVELLRNYYRHYCAGTLAEFQNTIRDDSYTGFLEHPAELRGKDYVPSTSERAGFQGALEHLLQLDVTRIWSTSGLPTGYSAIVTSRRDICENICWLADLVFGYGPQSQNLRITAPRTGLPETPAAFTTRNRAERFIVVYDPPSEFMEILERQRIAKQRAASTSDWNGGDGRQ